MIRAMSFTVTVPDEVSAQALAYQLAQRGHLLVAVRPEIDLTAWLAKQHHPQVAESSSVDVAGWLAQQRQPQVEERPEEVLTGWWNVHSMVVDPPYEGPLEESRAEIAALTALARRHRGKAHWACSHYPDRDILGFSRKGLTHELDRAEADRIRERIVAEQVAVVPTLTLPPGLKCGGFRRPGAELRAAGDALRAAAAGARLPVDPDAVDGVGDLVAEIADHAFHQGTAGPETADGVPLLAAVAGAEKVSDFYRVMALLVLFEMSTAGRRRVAYQVDTPAGAPGGRETDDEVAARSAVVAVLPGLVIHGVGRAELANFVLAALSAAGREAGAGMPAMFERIAVRDAGTARMPVVALIRAVADTDMAAMRAATAATTAALPEVIVGAPDREAATEGDALDVLNTVLQGELDTIRLPRLGRMFAGPR